MDIVLNFLLSQSILIPVVVAAIRIKRSPKIYYPFFALLLLGLLSELASFILIDLLNRSNAIAFNIFSLCESLIILYQLYLWKNAKRSRNLFICFAMICLAVWVIDDLIFLHIRSFSPYFRVFYAFLIVLLSINQINATMFYHEGAVFKDPGFIICLGFMIFFLYQILYEASFFVGSDKSDVANKIIMGFGYLNFAINLVYATGIFFIGQKKDEHVAYFGEQ